MAPCPRILAWEIPQTEGFVRGGRNRLYRQRYRQTEGVQTDCTPEATVHGLQQSWARLSD